MAHINRGAVKVVELVGVSQESFTDAARNAVAEASKTIRGIVGVDVLHSSAVVNDGEITEYHVDVKIAFPVERD